MRKELTFGLLLVVLGVIFLLLNLEFIGFNWLLFILSISLIFAYQSKKHILYLISGLVLLSISSVFLVDEYLFPGINIKFFIYLTFLGGFLIYLGIRNRENSFFIMSSISLSLGIYNLIKQLVSINITWLIFILLAIALYIVYYLVYRANGIEWPRYISLISLSIGIIYYLINKNFFRTAFKLISVFIIPTLIIGIGIKLIFIGRGNKY